jgi:hypothetical protein
VNITIHSKISWRINGDKMVKQLEAELIVSGVKNPDDTRWVPRLKITGDLTREAVDEVFKDPEKRRAPYTDVGDRTREAVDEVFPEARLRLFMYTWMPARDGNTGDVSYLVKNGAEASALITTLNARLESHGYHINPVGEY